jgi:cobalt-zinc-cadmium efflux system protein
MAHDHGPPLAKLGGRLLIGIAINVVILVAQIVGGVVAGSLALIADALHNLTDVASLGLSYFAFRVAKRPASERYTFAYQRAEVLAAVINAASLIAVSIYIAVEAAKRIADPQPVAGGLVIALAAFGMVANALAAWLLRGHGSNLNVRSAVLHLVSDSIASVGVVVAGVLMRFFGLYVVDPIVSLILAAWMTKESIGLLRGAAHILMQGVPEDVELDRVEEAMLAVEGVSAVHDLRVWALAPDSIVLSAHLVVDEGLSVERGTEVVRELKHDLHHRFGVEHATLEIETADSCAGISCD